MAPVTDTDMAVQPTPPTAITAAASGSGSVSGTATFGGSGASGFAADRSSGLNRVPVFGKQRFPGTIVSNGLKKTLFQATAHHRLLGIHHSALF
jgi:hypothetical protein